LSEGSRILIGHGSRLAGVANYYQNLATRLNADLAYWSIAPKITSKIEAKIASGEGKIAILPYFLFPGRITSAIAMEVERLRGQYPQVELHLGQPLGAKALARLIASA
jgi:sirohydrochlorin ferrochelatase